MTDTRKDSDRHYLAYREAIVNDKLEIRSTADSPEETIVDTIEISIDNKNWIKLSDFLLNNNWNKTIVDAVNSNHENIKPHEISLAEQKAVSDYVADAGPYANIKSLFDPKYDLHNYNGINKISLETVKRYLKTLVLMQSAYNKARIANTAKAPEVYRNIYILDKEISGDPTNDGSFVQANSVASTTSDRSVYSHRNIKLTIQSGNDGIPLEQIITDPNLRKRIEKSEKELFLGVRPLFISRGPQQKSEQPQQNSNQTEFKLTQVTRRAQDVIIARKCKYRVKRGKKNSFNQIAELLQTETSPIFTIYKDPPIAFLENFQHNYSKENSFDPSLNSKKFIMEFCQSIDGAAKLGDYEIVYLALNAIIKQSAASHGLLNQLQQVFINAKSTNSVNIVDTMQKALDEIESKASSTQFTMPEDPSNNNTMPYNSKYNK